MLCVLAIATLLASGFDFVPGAEPQPMDDCDKLIFTDTKLDNWNLIYIWNKEKCPGGDGFPAERYNDEITKLLSKKWDQFKDLQDLVNKDAKFSAFVLSHIEFCSDKKTIRAIIKNATQRCPEGSKKLCSDIIKSAREALIVN